MTAERKTGEASADARRPFNRAALLAIVMIPFTLPGILLALLFKAGSEDDDWQTSHFRYHIHSFWIVLIGVGAYFLAMTLWVRAAAFVLLFVAGWLLIRAVTALMCALSRAPVPDPKTWTF